MEIVPGGGEPQPGYLLGDRQERPFRHRLAEGRGLPRGVAADARRYAPADRRQPRYPQSRYVATSTRQSERPAGIYVWAIHAKGSIAAAIPLVLQKILDAALPRRQHLFAADHQGRLAGSGAARVLLRERVTTACIRAASADVRPFARGARGRGAARRLGHRAGRSFDGRDGAGDRDPRRRFISASSIVRSRKSSTATTFPQPT